MRVLGLKKKKDGLALLGGDNPSGLHSQLPLSTFPKSCCPPYTVSTAKYILVFSPSLLKLACVTVVLGCVKGRDLINQLSLNSTDPWGFEAALGGNTEFELPGITILLFERSIIQWRPAQKWTSKPHKQSARRKMCKNSNALRTKNNQQTMGRGTILVLYLAEKAETVCLTLCMKSPASDGRGLHFSLPPCSLTRKHQAHH